MLNDEPGGDCAKAWMGCDDFVFGCRVAGIAAAAKNKIVTPHPSFRTIASRFVIQHSGILKNSGPMLSPQTPRHHFTFQILSPHSFYKEGRQSDPASPCSRLAEASGFPRLSPTGVRSNVGRYRNAQSLSICIHILTTRLSIFISLLSAAAVLLYMY